MGESWYPVRENHKEETEILSKCSWWSPTPSLNDFDLTPRYNSDCAHTPHNRVGKWWIRGEGTALLIRRPWVHHQAGTLGPLSKALNHQLLGWYPVSIASRFGEKLQPNAVMSQVPHTPANTSHNKFQARCHLQIHMSMHGRAYSHNPSKSCARVVHCSMACVDRSPRIQGSTTGWCVSSREACLWGSDLQIPALQHLSVQRVRACQVAGFIFEFTYF